MFLVLTQTPKLDDQSIFCFNGNEFSHQMITLILELSLELIYIFSWEILGETFEVIFKWIMNKQHKHKCQYLEQQKTTVRNSSKHQSHKHIYLWCVKLRACIHCRALFHYRFTHRKWQYVFQMPVRDGQSVVFISCHNHAAFIKPHIYWAEHLNWSTWKDWGLNPRP